MAITVDYASKVTITDFPTFPGVAGNTAVRFADYDTEAQFTADSAVPATKHSEQLLALVSGSATIDLTSLPSYGVAAQVTFNGLKVQIAKFKTPTTNTADIVVTRGASNGYGHGAAGGTFTWRIPPGSEISFRVPDLNPDVDGTHKIWDVTGTGTESVMVELVAG